MPPAERGRARPVARAAGESGCDPASGGLVAGWAAPTKHDRKPYATHPPRIIGCPDLGPPLHRMTAIPPEILEHYRVYDEAGRLTRRGRLELEQASYHTVQGANAEMSAYLAQIAEAAGMRHYVVIKLTIFATLPYHDGTDESWASRAILGRGTR